MGQQTPQSKTRRTTAGAAVGPGRYDPSTALTHPSSKAMSFGTSSDRFAATPEEREAARIPAPGTYDLFDKDTRLVRDHETNKVVARRPDPSPWWASPVELEQRICMRRRPVASHHHRA